MSIPDILTVEEMQKMISAVLLRELVLIFLDMVTGLRRGELAGLKWTDIDLLNLQIDVSRSVVDQHMGRCKTEISQKPVPIDEYIARRPGGVVPANSLPRSHRLGFRYRQQPSR
jgi:integrase